MDGASVLREVLEKSAPRPSIKDPSTAKGQYAVRFANHIAERMAADLRPDFPEIVATSARSARSASGRTQLDINYSTLELGLGLGVSLKSVHTPDAGGSRYGKNFKRNLEELRIEASGYHKRQPYAVMVAVLFLPFDSCDDGRSAPSSFGTWVQKLRPYAGRLAPEDDIDKFEKIFVALYEPDGSDLRFFDVQSAPPRDQRPPKATEPIDLDGRGDGTLSYAQFLKAVSHAFVVRNYTEFKWADGGEEIVDPEADEGGWPDET